MTAGPPAGIFDYTNTARRRTWNDLPPAVRSAVEEEAGGPVHSVRSAGGGFTHGFAAVIESPATSLFVKAAPSSDPFIYSAYVREGEVLNLLPESLPIPQLHRSLTVVDREEQWRVLCFEAIDGYMPGDPWRAADLDAIHTSLLLTQNALTDLPRELTGGPMSAGISDDPMVNTVFSRLASGGVMPDFLPCDISSRLDDLQQLCDRSTEALHGDAVLHNDLRADNVLLRHSDGRAFICDWNYLAHGPTWADWVGLLIYARNGGIDPTPWLAESPLSAGADPDDVDSWLAILAAYMTHNGMQPDIVTSPHLRAHARFTAGITLDWLVQRRWS